MANQKKIGNTAEKIFCERLSEKGYWCHLLADKINGQPFDVIAIKDNAPFCFDVKNCRQYRFPFERIEPNQRTSMEYVSQKGKCYFVGFALFYQDKFYWLSYDKVKKMEKVGAKSVNLEVLKEIC